MRRDAFSAALDRLVRPLDPVAHKQEISRLRACRSLSDLRRLAEADWLSLSPREPRLKLVRHGSGTYLVVQYEGGWSSRLSMEPFPG